MTNVENIYKLTPLQSGILFHVLYDASDTNPYVAQSIDEFAGPLDVTRLREAWQAVVDRHTALRSAFVWERLDEPLQVVQRTVELPFEVLDWRSFPADEQERRLEGVLSEDRARGFDLGSAPLLRLTVVRLADERATVLWTFHHLLLDGWSTQMVQKEVFTLYRAATDGTAARLSDPVPYVRYIGWLGEQSQDHAERFWRRYLDGFAEPTALGIGGATGASGFGDVDLELGGVLARRLGDFARAHQVTVNTVVQGAWALLLSRYGGGDDVVYGSTVSGRPPELADAESIVGLFINTLPVRARVRSELPVAEWLRELQGEHVELRQYEYTSLVDAQEWSAVPKGEQLFQSILVFENYPKILGDSDLPENLAVHHQKGIARTGYPLTVAVGHTDEQLLMEITYDKSLFRHEEIERLAGHFAELLSSLAADPAALVVELEMLSAAELRALSVEWDGAEAGVSDAATLHGLVAERARECPDAVALTADEQSLSYGELNAQANRLAHHLKAHGVVTGTLVGVCLERGLDLVVGLLGVLKAGGAYVPLDPEYPAGRLAFMVEDTATPVVVTRAGLRERLPENGFTAVCLDADRAAIDCEPSDDLATDTAPDDLAYVIYTSGSTGAPKGVLVEHRSVVNRLRGTDGDFGLGPDDVWTLFHSFAFDFSVWEIWGALTYGGRLVVVDQETTRNAAAFARLLVEQKVTVLNQTPSAFGLLQQEVDRSLAGRLSLRLVVFGGEALQPARLGPWWAAVGEGGPRLVNMYGITETTVHVTAREITPADTANTGISPIGRPLADTGVYVLDAAGRMVPVGMAGELWVSGAGVARGYLNRAELTAERFVEREIGGTVRRMYRSGDLVRRSVDGELEYLGRLDDQVKVRGFRIELGEVEAALAAHPDVSADTVLMREDSPGDRRLVGYAVLAPGTDPTVADLREWCRGSLPDHMVPSAFVVLDELPLTSNGKVDRKALPAPDGTRPRLYAEYVAPRTPVEEAVTGIWAEVLGVDRVGIHDNFFELGGDSILSIQVISRAKRYDLHLTPRMIFLHQTVAEIVQHEHEVITRRSAEEAQTPTGLLATEYGLAPMQSGILFHVLYDTSETNPYLVQFPVEFVGPLDVPQLRKAWRAVVDRHTVLRTAFVWEGLDEPLQVVQRDIDVPFAELDWRGASADAQEQLLEGLLSDDRARGFELGTAPLLRLTVARMADERWMVLWSFHHMLLDGWSAQLVQKEVFAHYRASLENRTLRQGNPTPYARHIHWLDTQSKPESEEFWRRSLGDFEAPTDLGIDWVTGENGFADVEFEFTAAQSARFREFARIHRLTLNTVVQGAWSLLLSRYSGNDDVVYGNTVSGRPASLPEVESMVGLFINTLPVRTSMPADARVGEWLRGLQEQHLELRQYEYSSLAEIQGWSGVPKGEPLFKSILAFQNFPEFDADDLPHGLTRISRRNVERTGYPLTVMVYNNELLKIGISYDTSLFDRASIERMAGHFEVLMSSLVADAEAQLGGLEMLTEAEHQQMLVEWNDTAEVYTGDATLHRLVQLQALERPNAVAVVFGEEQLSYRELNERANRLAHYLRGRGVGPEVLVGVCIERGIDMVTALLAVLKAGGAYVPLDPEYPAERLEFLLRDTAAPVVLTREALRDRLPTGVRELVCLDADGVSIARQPATDPDSGVQPDNLAYVIYTSGSTGMPKGVQIRHRSILNRLHGTDGNFGFGPEDVWSLFHSFAFDFSVWEIWGALTYGGRLVVVDHETSRNAAAFAELLIEQRVTVLNQTPSAFSLLQEQVRPDVAGKLSLRLVIFGGEALQPTSLRSWWKANSGAGPRLVNMYGITETTVHATVRDITEADMERAAVSPIGQPLADTKMFVLDAVGRVVPVGVAGELWIAGVGLARGYLNRPDLTAERFVEREIGGSVRRMYRSGDLVRWLPSGELEYLGRLDHQVKVRGFRIELGEIESTLVAHPQITAAVVLMSEDVPNDRRLVAYVVPTDGALLGVGELREYCLTSLPDYMVPSSFVCLEALPFTVNGKVDRRALPAPDGARPELDTELVEPRNSVEEVLTRLWADVLGVDQVGVHDNFFELGGDSILSLQVISRAKRYGLHLPAHIIFDYETVAEIACHAPQDAAAPAAQDRVHGDAPLTPIQEWFFDLEQFEHRLFNQSKLLRTDDLDAAVLERALASVVEHHDALRLVFEHTSSSWTQTHRTVLESELLERHDISSLPEAELWEEMRRRADQLHRKVDLENGPLLRGALFELGAGHGQRLLIVVHHLAIDGVSWRILLRDLGETYGSLSVGERVVLPLKTTSYQVWAERLRQYASTTAATEELGYWAGQRRAVALPRDQAGANINASLGSVTLALDSEETRSLLRDLPSTFKTRINDVLLTAVAHAVRTWTGNDSVQFALEGHGRENLFPDIDLSRTVGWFTSLFPVEFRLESCEDLVAELEAVKEQLAGVPNRGIGYGILRYLGSTAVREELRDLARPEISFNYLGQFDAEVTGLGHYADDGEPKGEPIDPQGRRPHLIDIIASVHAGALSVTVHFSKNIHDENTAEALASSTVSALRELIRTARQQAVSGTGQESGDESYALTPMQAGILFHSLSDTSDQPEVRPYVAQFVDEFTGPLDRRILRRAWQEVVDRQTILRSSFTMDGESSARQTVHARTEIPFDEVDWRDADADALRGRLQRLLAEDRRRGFDLARPPLMRFTLAQTGDDRTLVIWSFHHLLLDGWSSQLVQQELYVCYRAALSGTTPVLPDPVPYSRYIEWLEERSQPEAEAFWRRALDGLTEPTALGVDRETGESGFGDVEFAVDGELSARIGEFAKSHRLTVNTIVQGMWTLLLSRYSGSEDVLYGSVVSGRPADLPGVESLVGPFINTLPVRAAAPHDARVIDWLRTLQEGHVELRQYEYSSLADIQRWSAIPGPDALFRSILIFENYPKLLTGDDLPDGLSRHRLQYVERTGYPLVLGAAYADSRLDLHLVHDRSMIDDATAQRMAGHLEQLLACIVDGDPEDTIGSVDLLTEADRSRLAAWNGPELAYADDVPVHALIERQAQERPDAVAVEFGDETITYRALNERANQLAHHLRTLGIRPETMVGLCLERGLDMIVALLGILKSGGAYVPLDTQYPAERLAFMIEDTALPVVVTQQHLAGQLPGSVGTLCLDREADTALLDSAPVTDPVPLAGPDDLAYVIYTSGSTGRPKGVMIEHRSMSDRVQEMRRQYGLTPDDVYLQFSSVTFDGSIGEIFPTLIAGARLVPRGDDWTPVEVLETIRTKDITVCQLPPFVWNELIPHLGEGTRPGPRLRLMSMGGERVLATSVERWFRRTSVPLFNIYGPTETTVNMTTCLLTGPATVVPIGTPVANTDVLVVDGTGRPAPIGASGELWIGGKGVARGYLNRPELTAERFVRDPRPEGAAGRMYRTGDLVRWLPDGQIDFIGRIDDQVKLRGFRIELGEIESTLTAHPRLTAGVVLLREDEPGARRLVAYCIAADGDRPVVSDLREWCARRLPDFMIPSVFTFLDALPVTANGKGVDRKALPAPGTDRTEVVTRYVAPATPTEELLADIWRDVLQVDSVSADDNFFELGGDSFLSIQVIAKARKNGIRLTPRIIFQNPTVAELARYAEGSKPSASTGRAENRSVENPIAVPRAASHRLTVVGADEAYKDDRVSVVALNESSSERLVFCFHEGGGNVTGYVHLAEELAPVARLMGIEARSVAFGTEPQGNLAEMALSYWEAIRTVQPSGPYVLAGWSFGGALAVEVTSLIEKAGGKVELLVALDSCLPVSGASEVIKRDLAAIDQLLSLLNAVEEMQDGHQTPPDVAKLMQWLNLPEAMLSLPGKELKNHLRTMQAHTQAVLSYRPPTVDAPIMLYQAQDSTWAVPLAETWQPFASQVDARMVSGDHVSFLRPPHVAAVGKTVMAALKELGA